MRKDKVPKSERQDYQFIKETIKKRPPDIWRLLKKGAAVLIGGAFFGLCAAVVFAWAAPRLLERLTGGEDPAKEVSLVMDPTDDTTDPADVRAAEPAAGDLESDAEALVQADGAAAADGNTAESADTAESAGSDDALAQYQQVYSQALEVSQTARKALVRVFGQSDSENLLDDSLLSSGNAEGIIILETDTYLYILSDWQPVDGTKSLLVAFSDDSTAKGYLCRADERIGLSVIRVLESELSEDTRNSIEAAELDETYDLQQAEAVIAIGSPSGEFDGVQYGVVTSVTQRLSLRDVEYSRITTNMQGCSDSSGVLLNTEGKIVAVITRADGDDTDFIRALPIRQLCPMIEQMANKKRVRCLGVYGISITEEQAQELGIPQGVYVEKVDRSSTAMTAGLQRGDIITALDGERIYDMHIYTGYLQSCDVGQEIKVTVQRSNGDGELGEMELTITVGVHE